MPPRDRHNTSSIFTAIIVYQRLAGFRLLSKLLVRVCLHVVWELIGLRWLEIYILQTGNWKTVATKWPEPLNLEYRIVPSTDFKYFGMSARRTAGADMWPDCRPAALKYLFTHANQPDCETHIMSMELSLWSASNKIPVVRSSGQITTAEGPKNYCTYQIMRGRAGNIGGQ